MSFFKKCGTPLNGEQNELGIMKENKKTKKRISAWCKCAISVVALAAVITASGCSMPGKGGNEAATEQSKSEAATEQSKSEVAVEQSGKSVALDFLNAEFNADAKKIVSLLPEEMVSYIAKEEYDGNKDKMMADLEESMKKEKEALEKQGINIKEDIKYEVKNEKDVTADELKKLNDQAEIKQSGITVEEAKKVEVEMTMKADGKEETNTVTIVTGKVGGKWCLLDF